MTTPTPEQPRFPMERESPYDPPPGILRLLREEPVSRVTLWDGHEAWLVTRYDDVRTLLTNPDLSADVRRPGYPKVSAALAHFTEGLLNHMDSPEHDGYRGRRRRPGAPRLPRGAHRGQEDRPGHRHAQPDGDRVRRQRAARRDRARHPGRAAADRRLRHHGQHDRPRDPHAAAPSRPARGAEDGSRAVARGGGGAAALPDDHASRAPPGGDGR